MRITPASKMKATPPRTPPTIAPTCELDDVDSREDEEPIVEGSGTGMYGSVVGAPTIVVKFASTIEPPSR